MNAEVVPYSDTPQDTVLSLKVECLDCHIEWGWAWDHGNNHAQLQRMADEHNATFHSDNIPPKGPENG